LGYVLIIMIWGICGRNGVDCCKNCKWRYTCISLGTIHKYFYILARERIGDGLCSAERERECYFTTGGLPPISSSWRQAPWVVYNCCWPSPAQPFLDPNSAGLVAIFYCFRFQTPNLDGQVPVFISPRNGVAQLHPQALGSLVVPFSLSVSELSYDRRSVGQSVLVSSPHLGLITRSLLLSDNCRFVDMGRPLWREGGSVVYNCCCLRQHSHSQVRVPRGSWPHFTVSDYALLLAAFATTAVCTLELSLSPSWLSLYNLCTGPTENTTSDNSSVVAYQLPRSRASCRPLHCNESLFNRVIACLLCRNLAMDVFSD
jgi:hypothetical protein